MSEPSNDSGRKLWKRFDTIIAMVLLAVTGFVTAGFFFPDPRFGHPAFLWAARVGTVLVGAGLVLLYWAVRTGRLSPGVVALMVVSVCLCVLIVYPFASYLYNRSFRSTTALFHPYLQLVPKPYHLRKSADEKPPLRIFCLGGSTTEFVDSQGKGWPSRLEERLRGSVPGRKIEVHNLGRQWYTSLHILINYAANLRQYKPDVIIVMVAINDLLHNADFSRFSVAPFRADYRHFYGPIYRLIEHPSLMGRVSQMARRMWYYPSPEPVDTDVFPGLKPFARNLGTLIDLARIDGTQVVLMAEPNIYKDSLTPKEKAALAMVNTEAVGMNKRWTVGTAMRGMQEYNAEILKLAKKKGTFFIDLDKAVPKDLDHFRDDVHYKDSSFDLIAGYIAGKIRKYGVLLAKKSPHKNLHVEKEAAAPQVRNHQDNPHVSDRPARQAHRFGVN
ncbi:MAG: GDSL-type esterase/lipase family protein [Deltaproteobacteria bacterium]